MFAGRRLVSCPALRRGAVVFALTAVAVGAASCASDDCACFAAPPNFTSLSLRPDTLMMQVGDTFTLQIALEDTDHDSLSAHDALWSSSDAAIAGIDDRGTVTGVLVGGPVTITATAGTKSDSAVVYLTP